MKLYITLPGLPVKVLLVGTIAQLTDHILHCIRNILRRLYIDYPIMRYGKRRLTLCLCSSDNFSATGKDGTFRRRLPSVVILKCSITGVLVTSTLLSSRFKPALRSLRLINLMCSPIFNIHKAYPAGLLYHMFQS